MCDQLNVMKKLVADKQIIIQNQDQTIYAQQCQLEKAYSEIQQLKQQNKL